MPLTRSNLEETSYLRKLLQYREIIARGVFRQHLGITKAPLLLLTVTTNRRHLDGIMALLRELADEQAWTEAFLFKAVPNLGSFQRAPHPTHSLLTEAWDRVGNPPLFINRTEL